MVGIGAFRVFMRTRFNIESNSLSRAEDLAAVNHVTQAVVIVGSKILKVGFKELRLEPKLLNRGLRQNINILCQKLC